MCLAVNTESQRDDRTGVPSSLISIGCFLIFHCWTKYHTVHPKKYKHCTPYVYAKLHFLRKPMAFKQNEHRSNMNRLVARLTGKRISIGPDRNGKCLQCLKGISMNTSERYIMTMLWHGDVFRITSPLCGESTGDRWMNNKYTVISIVLLIDIFTDRDQGLIYIIYFFMSWIASSKGSFQNYNMLALLDIY